MIQLLRLIVDIILLVLLQVCLMLVSRAKSGKKQSSDVAIFQVDCLKYVTVTMTLTK